MDRLNFSTFGNSVPLRRLQCLSRNRASDGITEFLSLTPGGFRNLLQNSFTFPVAGVLRSLADFGFLKFLVTVSR